MFSNFEPLRGLEPRTHALRMRNRILKISELEGRMKNLYRNKTKKIKHVLDDEACYCFCLLDFGLVDLRGRGWRGWSADREEAEDDREERRDMEDWLEFLSCSISERAV